VRFTLHFILLLNFSNLGAHNDEQKWAGKNNPQNLFVFYCAAMAGAIASAAPQK
jgi:hypothetical protein